LSEGLAFVLLLVAAGVGGVTFAVLFVSALPLLGCGVFGGAVDGGLLGGLSLEQEGCLSVFLVLLDGPTPPEEKTGPQRSKAPMGRDPGRPEKKKL
jgi:hypothetical protein